MSVEPAISGLSAADPEPVGRRREVARVARAVAAARAGARALVLIQGQTGIGKTTLLDAALAEAAADGTTVLRARCPDTPRPPAPYALVRALVAPLGLTGPDAAESPLLRSGARWALPALSEPGSAEPRTEPGSAYAVLHGLYWLAVNIAEAGPLVLAVDDLHWCDELSLRWLDYLFRRADGRSLAVVAAVRTPAPPAVLDVLAEHLGTDAATVVALGPLDADGVRAAVAARLGAAPDRAFLAACRGLSGGHPQVLSRLLDEACLRGLPPDDTAVDRLRVLGRDIRAASVLGRLRAQPEHVRRVARAVAVLGCADPDPVSVLSGVPLRLVAATVQLLRDNDILGQPGEDAIDDQIRAGLLGELRPGEVDRMRDRAARLLNDAGRPAETVAAHLLPLLATPQPWMRTVLRDAAAEACRRGAPEAALRHLSPLLERDPDDVVLRGQVAGLLVQTDPPRALRHLRVALDAAADPRTRAGLAVQFGMTALAVRRSPEAMTVLTKALAALDAEIGAGAGSADRDLRTMVEATLVLVGFDHKSTIGLVRDRLDRVPDPPGGTPAERHLLAVKALAGAAGGVSLERVTARARRSLRLDDVDIGGWSVTLSSMVLALADEVPEALGVLDRLLALCGERGGAWTACHALGVRAFVLQCAGEPTESAADAQLALDLAHREGWQTSEAQAAVAFATALVPLGEIDRAQAVLDTVEVDQVRDVPWQGHNYLFARGTASAQQGDVERALVHLRQCGASLAEDRIANPLFLPWWAEAVFLLADGHRLREAVPLVELGEELAAGWPVPRARGLGLTTRAVVTEGAAAIDLLTEAVRVLADSGALLDRQRAQFLLGRELLRRGDTRPAREHLRAAVDMAARCGARAAAVGARELLLMAGGRMRQVTGARADVLTGSERRVAGMAAAGSTNREIAEALFVTSRTVEVHLTNAYRKLGIGGRVELAPALDDGYETRRACDLVEGHRVPRPTR
ncbi:AAA family ATPase [Actinokineospora sp.]|uniref:AAA family ATPase n=1 Tax=Actinokineospora sp. TaxID=1872133 RepID=UPI0040383AB6